jgi:hypothetical protein
MDIKHTLQIHKNYEMFKEAIGQLVDKTNYSDEKKDYLHNKAKAELYNIDWDYSIYDPVGLKQAVDEQEFIEMGAKHNDKWDYYNKLGCSK